MRKRTSAVALALAAALTACSADDDEPLPFDSTTENLRLRGTVSGLDLDISDAEVIAGEREYSPTRLCEVSGEWSAMVDGELWAVEVELENFDLESFGVGNYAIIGSDVAPGPGQTSFELRMDGDAIHYERSAIGGSIDVRVYEPGTTVPGDPDVMEGGSLGATFEVDFGAGETMEGSFHVEFSVAAVEDEEC